MRALRLVVNFTIVLTAPVWLIPVMIPILFIEYIKRTWAEAPESTRMEFSGKKWLWEE